MNSKTITASCPKCNGDMAQGFIPDYSYGTCHVGSWHAGQPQKSFWAGTKAPISGGIPIGAFRCKGCGYLEFYSKECFASE